MLGVIIGIVAILLGASIILRRAGVPAGGHRLVQIFSSRFMGIILVLIGGFMLLSSSFILVDANSVGHLKRIYAFEELPEGRILQADHALIFERIANLENKTMAAVADAEVLVSLTG